MSVSASFPEVGASAISIRDALDPAHRVAATADNRSLDELVAADVELRALAQRWHHLVPEVRRALLVLAGIAVSSSSRRQRASP